MEHQKLFHHEVIDNNTHAIGLMLEGRQDEALELFHGTLYIAKVLFDAKVHPGLRDQRSNAEQTCVYEVSLDEVIYPFDCSERASPDNCFKVRRCLFAVDAMHGVNTGAALRKVLAVVTYNLGVIYHECGLACANTEMLSRSRWLYNVAIAILAKPEDSEPRDTCMIPFEMALFNNLGHIYGVFNDREGTTNCCQRVKEMLAECGQTTLDEGVYEFFESSFIPQSHLNKAPAA